MGGKVFSIVALTKIFLCPFNCQVHIFCLAHALLTGKTPLLEWLFAPAMVRANPLSQMFSFTSKFCSPFFFFSPFVPGTLLAHCSEHRQL